MKRSGKPPVAEWAARFAFALLFAALCAPLCAHAEDTDPFQQDTGVWKSFDRYKEEQKDKQFSAMTGNLAADQKAEAMRDASDAESEPEPEPNLIVPPLENKKADNATGTQTLAADGKSPLAPPERALVLPAMPALTPARFNVTVDTTVDDEKPPAHIAHIETDPDLQLPKQNWLNASVAAQLHAMGRDEMSENKEINIRLTFLPSFRAPEPQHKPAPVAVAAVKPPPSLAPAANPADAAACAAIDAYKKRELAAIQSDRNTLTALQAAIAELGLKKQLNFVAGEDSKIDTPDSGAGNGGMNPILKAGTP